MQTDAEREAERIRVAIKEEQATDSNKARAIDSARALVEKLGEAGYKVTVDYNDEMRTSTIDAPSSDPGQMQLTFGARMTYDNGSLPRIEFLNKDGDRVYTPSIRYEWHYGTRVGWATYRSATKFKVILETGSYGDRGRTKTYIERKHGNGINVEKILERIKECIDLRKAKSRAAIESKKNLNRRDEILKSVREKHTIREYSSRLGTNSGFVGGKWKDYEGIKFTMSFSSDQAGEAKLRKLLQVLEDHMPEALDKEKEV